MEKREEKKWSLTLLVGWKPWVHTGSVITSSFMYALLLVKVARKPSSVFKNPNNALDFGLRASIWRSLSFYLQHYRQRRRKGEATKSRCTKLTWSRHIALRDGNRRKPHQLFSLIFSLFYCTWTPLRSSEFLSLLCGRTGQVVTFHDWVLIQWTNYIEEEEEEKKFPRCSSDRKQNVREIPV